MVHMLYFNPRSHEGSDALIEAVPYPDRDFNPRSHEGSDALIEAVPYPDRDFNPRSHEGSDVFGDRADRFQYRFQSTLPRRERHSNGAAH